MGAPPHPRHAHRLHAATGWTATAHVAACFWPSSHTRTACALEIRRAMMMMGCPPNAALGARPS